MLTGGQKRPQPVGVPASERIGGDSVPRNTYVQPDGSRATHDLYIVLDYGYGFQGYTVTTTVGGLTVSHQLGVPPMPAIDMSASVHDLSAVDLAGHD